MVKKQCDHTKPTLTSLHLVLIHFRIHFKYVLIDYKSLNGLVPPYLTDLLKTYNPTVPEPTVHKPLGLSGTGCGLLLLKLIYSNFQCVVHLEMLFCIGVDI